MGRRFPSNWPDLLHEYRNRDYPLSLGWLSHRLLRHPGAPARVNVNLYYLYYDDPASCTICYDTSPTCGSPPGEEVLAQVDVDMVHIWEDISSGKRFHAIAQDVPDLPLAVLSALHQVSQGWWIDIILVDTDGDCRDLIPLFLEAGVTGLYPMEVSAGMDVLAARKAYPDLQIMGGIPKHDIALGEARTACPGAGCRVVAAGRLCALCRSLGST